MVQLRIKTDAFGTIAPMGTGRYGLGVLECEAEGDDLAYRLEMTVEVVHGKPVCTKLTAHQRDGGPPVTRRGLNSLPVAQLVRQIASRASIRVTEGDEVTRYSPAGPEGVAEVYQDLAPPRGRRADPETRQQRVREAVDAYRQLTGEAGIKQPKRHIATEMNLSVSTIASLLAEGRRLGLLGPAIPGRAGEVKEGQTHGSQS